MAYGIHWEWRGFGELSEAVRARVCELRVFRAANSVKLVDHYLWVPGCDINVKLRSFRDGESLKLKRRLEVYHHENLQLWMERPEEDYCFPLEWKAINEVTGALGIDLETKATVHNGSEFLGLLKPATERVKIVTVVKTRHLHVWSAEGVRVLVDFGEISSPQQMVTVGLEDLSGLNESSPREEVVAASNTVIAARSALGLPDKLSASSYLEVLTRWAEAYGVGV